MDTSGTCFCIDTYMVMFMMSGTCFCTMLQENWISDALVPMIQAEIVHVLQENWIYDVLVPMIQAEIVHVPQDEMLNESAADGGTHCSGYVSAKRGALVPNRRRKNDLPRSTWSF